ncbi:MAG: HNH endonuclease [Streptomycetaceae bacterium]|nr:HNH endonuclease [Streptomycetaceae bacterium]
MPRIRTVKPELWEDEVVGLLPRDARLLFIATFNMADDEGLLRWTPSYIKASAFMYDDDLTVADVGKLMHCLTDAGLLYPYIGGVARQQMAMVVNFRKHQRINRPQKSKLPPPSLQNPEVRRVYGRRDGWTCQLCGGGIPERPVRNDSHNLSIDHIKPQSAGGTDHPSNVRATHQACNKSRRDGLDDEFIPPRSLNGLNDSLNESVNGSMNGYVSDAYASATAQRDENTHEAAKTSTQSDIYSLNDSVNDSLTNSPPERKGKEGNRERKGTPQPPAPESAHEPAVVQTGRALPDRMTDAFLERFARGNAYGRRQIRRVIADTLANGTDSNELWQALLRLGETSKPVSAGTLQFAFAKIREAALPAAAGAENVIQLPTGLYATGTDRRVAEHLALAAQMKAEEDQNDPR